MLPNHIGWFGSIVWIASIMWIWSVEGLALESSLDQMCDWVCFGCSVWCQVPIQLWSNQTFNWPKRVAILGYGSGNARKGWQDRALCHDHWWNLTLWYLVFSRRVWCVIHEGSYSLCFLIAGTPEGGGPDHRKDVWWLAGPNGGSVGAPASYQTV